MSNVEVEQDEFGLRDITFKKDNYVRCPKTCFHNRCGFRFNVYAKRLPLYWIVDQLIRLGEYVSITHYKNYIDQKNIQQTPDLDTPTSFSTASPNIQLRMNQHNWTSVP